MRRRRYVRIRQLTTAAASQKGALDTVMLRHLVRHSWTHGVGAHGRHGGPAGGAGTGRRVADATLSEELLSTEPGSSPR